MELSAKAKMEPRKPQGSGRGCFLTGYPKPLKLEGKMVPPDPVYPDFHLLENKCQEMMVPAQDSPPDDASLGP